eukprot:TRINITY_DN70900_c0_g1_i1.p1 TRINITY_DN70900_c0_g1~~TRINITY_DN70900_c0_g1_i1.p1  ORF type:complete len:373 (+),score=138.32 TRINITY_DN70900_c0_g1_i1:76-1119(+)
MGDADAVPLAPSWGEWLEQSLLDAVHPNVRWAVEEGGAGRSSARSVLIDFAAVVVLWLMTAVWCALRRQQPAMYIGRWYRSAGGVEGGMRSLFAVSALGSWAVLCYERFAAGCGAEIFLPSEVLALLLAATQLLPKLPAVEALFAEIFAVCPVMALAQMLLHATPWLRPLAVCVDRSAATTAVGAPREGLRLGCVWVLLLAQIGIPFRAVCLQEITLPHHSLARTLRTAAAFSAYSLLAGTVYCFTRGANYMWLAYVPESVVAAVQGTVPALVPVLVGEHYRCVLVCAITAAVLFVRHCLLQPLHRACFRRLTERRQMMQQQADEEREAEEREAAAKGKKKLDKKRR